MDINQEYVAEVINISKIKEGLYGGDEIAATNLDVIIQFKLTHMLNAAGSEIKNKWETIGIKYLTLNWSDIPTQNLFDSRDEIANRIVSFIDDALERGEGILAHSLNGMNRVCIVIVIYLMKKYKWCLQKCIEYIQTKKTDVNIQPYFIEQLQRFQERLIRKGEQIKPASWNDDDISDEEERLLRNTYINSLESCPSKVPKELINVKKRKHIEWADANPYKKEMLVHINEAQDLFYQRDPRPVTIHKRMRPGRSCIRKRSLSVGDMVRSNSKGNMKGSVGVNNMNEGKQGNMGDMGIIPNSYNINNVRPLMQRQNSATQATVGVCIGGDIGMVNMIGNNNINIQQSQQQQQQQISVVGVSEKGQQGINNFIPIQRSIQVNANNSGINQRFFNVNANDLINNYAKFYNNQNAGNNNNSNSNNNNINPSVNVNMNMNVNQQQPNLPRTNSFTNKDPSAFLNMKNNFNIASPNSLNPDNLRNYSMYKDNNNNNMSNNNQNNNPNTNNKENIIFATKYEQIINNNIINISNNITQNNPNNNTDIDNALAAQKGKAYIKMPTTSSSASNINNAGIGPIPNIQFPSNTNNINYRFNNSNTNNNNQLLQNKQDPSSILTNNYLNNQNQIINPNMRIINHNNNFDNNERKMKVIDYSNSTPGTVLNNYHPQPQLHKNKPQSNHPQNQCK